MVFTASKRGEPRPLPACVAAGDFVLDKDSYAETNAIGRKAPLTCALSRKSYDCDDLRERVDLLSRGLCKALGWKSTEGSPWDKVVAIYSVNCLDYLPLCWAIQRIGGICLLLHPTSPLVELVSQLKIARAKAIFSCHLLFENCLNVAEQAGIVSTRIFAIDLPSKIPRETDIDRDHTSVEDLADLGESAPEIKGFRWDSKSDEEQIAFLCATSGTSGKQKLAKFTHLNIIANCLQTIAFEEPTKKGRAEVCTGFLPMSHSYGLVTAHLQIYRGDGIIVFPSFDLQVLLGAIKRFKIERIYLIPPITAALANNPIFFEKFDTSSVVSIVSGAGPFGRELNLAISKVRPTWEILPGYGLTETSVVTSLTDPNDQWAGSAGELMPWYEARIVDAFGNDVTAYDTPGELYLRSPSNMQGYLGDSEADAAAFAPDRWLRTGDVGMFRVSPKGREHLFIVDRLKDMIKVKGLQVAPAELESFLIKHPAVDDVAVLGVPDKLAGERPQAYIVRSTKHMADVSDHDLVSVLSKHVEDNMTESYLLHRRIKFLSQIPRNGAGKILKKDLRAQIAQEKGA